MRDLDEALTKAWAAIRGRRYDEALQRFEALTDEEFPVDAQGHLGLAVIHEGGSSEHGVNLEKAKDSYLFLASRSERWGSLGDIGIARVLSRMDRCANQDEIEAHCRRAIEIDGSIAASYFLARIHEECRGEHVAARAHYLRMFRHGRPLGLRHYARSHMAHGSKLVGVLAHLVTTLVAPILFIVHRGKIIPEHDR